MPPRRPSTRPQLIRDNRKNRTGIKMDRTSSAIPHVVSFLFIVHWNIVDIFRMFVHISKVITI